MPKRRQVTLGSLVQLVIRIVGLLCGAIVAALQARTLTVTDFGVLSLIFSISAMAIVLSDLGIMNTAVRKLATCPEQRSKTISGLLTSRFIMGLFLALFGFVASALLLESREALMAAALILAALPLGSLTATQAISQAELHFVVVNTLLGLQNFLWLAAVVFLAWSDASLLEFALAFLICALIQSTTTWLLCGRGLRFSLRTGLSETWPLMRQALPIGIGSLAVTGYYRLTGIVLYANAGPEVAGNFSAAFRILDAMQAIPATLSATFLPLMSRYFSQQKNVLAATAWDLALRLLLTSSVMLAVVIALLAEPIVEVLYGTKYASAAGLLALLMIAFAPVCVGWLLTGVITATGRVRAYAFVAVAVAIVSVAASLILIPIYGASGAALITVCTEFLVMTGLAVVVYRGTGLAIAIGMLIRLSVAAALTAVAIIAARPHGLLAGLVVAAVVGSCSILLLQVLHVKDIKTLLRKGETLG